MGQGKSFGFSSQFTLSFRLNFRLSWVDINSNAVTAMNDLCFWPEMSCVDCRGKHVQKAKEGQKRRDKFNPVLDPKDDDQHRHHTTPWPPSTDARIQ